MNIIKNKNYAKCLVLTNGTLQGFIDEKSLMISLKSSTIFSRSIDRSMERSVPDVFMFVQITVDKTAKKNIKENLYSLEFGKNFIDV